MTAAKAKTWLADDVRALGVTTDLVTAGSVLGLSKNTAYRLAEACDFPVRLLRLGAQYRVPVADLLRLLGIDPDMDAAALSGAADVTATTAEETRRHDQPRTIRVV